MAYPLSVPCRSCGQTVAHGDPYCQHCGQPDPTAGGGPSSTWSPTGTPSAPPPNAETAHVEETFAAQGQVRQNQTYVGNRLMFTRHGEVESNFANVVSGGMVWAHFKRVLVTQVIVWVVALVILIPMSLLAAARSFGTETGSPGTVLVGLLFTAISIGLLISAFRGLLQQPMSEWELLLDERSPSSDSAYAAISLALQRRAVPAAVYAQRIAQDVTTGAVGNYLVVRARPYVVYITVLPYGTGLYLAWSMWREQRVISLYAEWFRQLRNNWAGTGSLLNMLLRAETARALRETVHNAVRDGVETAIEARNVELSSAFGASVPAVVAAPHGTPLSASAAREIPVPPRPPRPDGRGYV